MKKVLIFAIVALLLSLTVGSALAGKPLGLPVEVRRATGDGVVILVKGATTAGYQIGYIPEMAPAEDEVFSPLPTLGDGRWNVHFGAGTDYRNHVFLGSSIVNQTFGLYRLIDASGVTVQTWNGK